MVIKRIEIKAFAGLKDFSLDFDSGLNCVYGANEAGKSTILNFILAMFYGLGDRRGKDNFRDQVKPRSGEQIQGNILFSHEGRNYELQRLFAERTALDETRLIDLASNRTIELKDPVQPGKELLGLEEEVFKNTLFVDAEGSKLLESKDLANMLWSKLLDFLVNPESDIKVNEIQNNLESEKLSLKSRNGRKGLIPELELELSELRQEKYRLDNKIDAQTEEINKLSEEQEQISILEKEMEDLNKKIKVLKLLERQEVLRLINAPKLLLEEREAEASLLAEKLSKFSHSNSEESTKFLADLEIDSERFSEESDYILASLENLGAHQDSLLNSLDNYETRLLRKEELASKKNSDEQRLSKSRVNIYSVTVIVILLTAIVLLIFRNSSDYFLIIAVSLLGLAAIMGLFKSRIFKQNSIVLELEEDRSNEILKQYRNIAATELEEYQELLQMFSLNWRSLSINLDLTEGAEDQLEAELSREVSRIQMLKKQLNAEVKQRKIYQEQAKDLAFLSKDISRLKDEIKNSNYSDNDIQNLEESIKRDSEILLPNVSELPEFDLSHLNRLEIKHKEVNEQIREREAAITEIKQKLKILSIDPISHENISLQSRSFAVSELIESKQEELDVAKLKYQAYELAEEKLTESLLEFRQVLLPELGESASKYIEVISSGEYSQIRINDDLAINLKGQDFYTDFTENKLSSGTVEQIYLAYRLALIEYICKNREYTLLLDDPFVFFDEDRLISSLRLIERFSETQNKQVILFTCHKHIFTKLNERPRWKIKLL